MKLILASASPRRKELLRYITEDFTVRVSNADETVPAGLTPEETVKYLSRVKADAVFTGSRDEVIVASDTVVVIDGAVLGKPHSEEEAVEMLRTLSGRTHTVYTGVCVRTAAEEEVFAERTDVTFYPLTEEEIRAYVATGEPMDKAGAYGIQGKGCRLVKRIDGDYFTVVGLPVAELVRRLEAHEKAEEEKTGA